MMPSSSATDTNTKPSSSLPVVESIKCHTCCFVEEYTQAYIYHVKEQHNGHWICGLCAEAVKEELIRSPTRISVEEALRRHKTFYQRFNSWSPDQEEYPISLTGRILRRSLDDGSLLRTTTRTSSSGALPAINDVESRRSFRRSGSCFPSLC